LRELNDAGFHQFKAPGRSKQKRGFGDPELDPTHSHVQDAVAMDDTVSSLEYIDEDRAGGRPKRRR
jgi:hypothetical protein